MKALRNRNSWRVFENRERRQGMWKDTKGDEAGQTRGSECGEC